MVTSNFVETPGLRIHYLQEGTGDPVVFLHGFPETSHQWRHQIRALTDAGYACFAPDNRGFGRTDKPLTRIDRALLARDVARFLDAIGVDSAHFVTHDWGGIIGFKFLADFPGRVRSFAAIDTLLTVWAPKAVHGYWFKAPGLAEEFFAEHHRTFIECSFGGRAFDDLPPRPASPWGFASGGRDRPAWIDAEDLDHYIEAMADPGSHHAAIQYYRYGLPFHVVEKDGSFRPLDETAVAEMWLHPAGLEAHPDYAHHMDFGPEDRATRYDGKALWLYGGYLGDAGREQGDPHIPAGNPFVDQFSTYLMNLSARAVKGRHFLGEEQPAFVNECLLDHLGP